MRRRSTIRAMKSRVCQLPPRQAWSSAQEFMSRKPRRKPGIMSITRNKPARARRAFRRGSIRSSGHPIRPLSGRRGCRKSTICRCRRKTKSARIEAKWRRSRIPKPSAARCSSGLPHLASAARKERRTGPAPRDRQAAARQPAPGRRPTGSRSQTGACRIRQTCAASAGPAKNSATGGGHAWQRRLSIAGTRRGPARDPGFPAAPIELKKSLEIQRWSRFRRKRPATFPEPAPSGRGLTYPVLPTYPARLLSYYIAINRISSRFRVRARAPASSNACIRQLESAEWSLPQIRKNHSSRLGT